MGWGREIAVLIPKYAIARKGSGGVVCRLMYW